MNRIEIVKTELQNRLNKSNTLENIGNAYIHLHGVSHFAALLATKRKLNSELCIVMGLLHDIYTYTNGYDKQHAEFGSKIAHEFLTNLNIFTTDEISEICNAISNHSDKKNIHDSYSELLKDADSIQNFLQEPFEGFKHKKRIKIVLKELGIDTKLKEIIIYNKPTPLI